MAGDVQPLATRAASRTPTAATLLRAAGGLWLASSIDGVADAARNLVATLMPCAGLYRCSQAAAKAVADRYRLVPLSRHETLVISASPANREQRILLDAALKLVAARAIAMARQVALTASVEEMARAERLQRAQYAIADQASASNTDLTAMLAALHRIVGSLMYAENFFIALYDAVHARVQFPYYADSVADAVFEPGRDHAMAEIMYGPTWYVIHEGKPLMGSVDTMRRQVRGPLHGTGPVSEDWLGVPLLRDNDTVGCVVVQSYDGAHHYDEQDKALLAYVAQHIQTALERRQAHAQLERRVAERTEALRQAYSGLEHRVGERTRALALANRDLRAQIAERERIEARLKYDTLHDSLTGLPNRSLLMQRMESALHRYQSDPRQGFAVLFMDLDRFKIINDSVGHLIGDDLLFHAGNRIRSCLKSGDMVARLGGDEFGVVLDDIDDADQACGIAERIIDNFNAPFRLAGKELFTSVSIGITLGTAHYRRAEELLRDADSAMYRAKGDGRRRYAVFDEGLRQQAIALLEVGNDLRRGVERREFVPWYQPIVDTAQRVVVGYEALMRWHHPERGVLLPSAFLNVAEDSGISETIDWQIFEQVCADANALAGTSGAFVGINLSAQHFRDAELGHRLLGLLATRAVATARFRVEVTERALLENTPLVRRALQSLRGAGTGTALDDFGTGFSSLSYLHQYPLETLKIDQSFIANLKEGDQGSSVAVIRAILAMANALSMQVIAEGVETRAQHELLRALGCRYMQGFLYAEARPVTAWTGGDVPHFPR